MTAIDQSERMVSLTQARVERIDVEAQFTITQQAARDYIRATRFADLADRVTDLPSRLTVTAAGSVFIATSPA